VLRLLRLWQEHLGQGVHDAGRIRAEVRGELSSIELSGLSVVFVQDFLTCAAEGGWQRDIEQLFELFRRGVRSGDVENASEPVRAIANLNWGGGGTGLGGGVVGVIGMLPPHAKVAVRALVAREALICSMRLASIRLDWDMMVAICVGISKGTKDETCSVSVKRLKGMKDGNNTGQVHLIYDLHVACLRRNVCCTHRQPQCLFPKLVL
jgi:hypothetical protein